MNISAKKAHFMLMKWLPGITLCPRILPESTQGNHFWTKSSTARETYPYFQDFRKTAWPPPQIMPEPIKSSGRGAFPAVESLWNVSPFEASDNGDHFRAEIFRHMDCMTVPTLPLALVGEKCHSEHFRPLSHISEIELACCNPTLNNTIIIIIMILLLSYT